MTTTNSHSKLSQEKSSSNSSRRSKDHLLAGLGLLTRLRPTTSQKPADSDRQTSVPRRATSRKSQPARQAKSTSAPPPVMARSYNMDMPFPSSQSYTKKNRRRVDVPLNIPGAEIRLPAVPALRFSARWLMLLVFIVFLGALYFAWHAPFFQVGKPQVEGLKRVRVSDVNAVLDIEGKPIFTMHTAKLEAKLMSAFPEFAAVAVQTSLPNSVSVKVTERTPVLTWRQNGLDQLIDANGYIFPIRLSSSQVISPVVEAAGDPPLVAARAVQDLEKTISAATDALAKNGNTNSSLQTKDEKTATGGPFLTIGMVKAIQEISKAIPNGAALLYDPHHGFGWQDQRGWKVYLGDEQDVEMKLKVYDAIVKSLETEDTPPVLISVEHVHNPYYRLTQ